ncbi:nuclear transport factor 2 family protein [Rhizorhapis suberifaciens]|uniref:Uncharacterized protein (TIGR02246 family) n=1 Tax=Rhizorhapis suberifaciens TaxID=13656 RepID=A0A840HTY1_9SPHN|nr:nuclear transport factor 2 family protein [Rhizorhapis suberifaciens]MBB4641455.1 uncharacterized protein (TIGR02246 family) [Rhizorhapis suberifaciens]
MPREDHMTIDPADRFAVQDCLGRYLSALDRGDLDGVFATLATPDCRFVDTRGNIHSGPAQIRAMLEGLVGDPDFRGRQHIVTPLFAERIGADIIVESYWMVVKWSFAENRKEIFSIGHSRDTLTQCDDGWRIRERRLSWRTEQHGPWHGAH